MPHSSNINSKLFITMKKSTSIFIFTSLVLGNISVALSTSTLKAVFILFRHGERWPVLTYPNDPYKDHDWPGGMASLTQVGIRQMYNMGVKFRARYASLIPNDGLYSQHRIRVNSSAAERCLMSAQSFMAGFLPPDDKTNILPIKWQPVPIHSIPMKQDPILSGERSCHKFENIDSKNLELDGPEIKEILKENLTLFYETFNNNIGRKVVNLKDFARIADIFTITIRYGRKLPDWIQPIYNETIKPIAEVGFYHVRNSHALQASSGALIYEMLKFFVLVKNGASMNIYINSAHDHVLASLSKLIQITTQIPFWPDLGAAFSIELRQNSKIVNDLEMRILYFQNSEDPNPLNVRIPNCPAPCALVKFYSIIKSKIIKDFNKECD